MGLWRTSSFLNVEWISNRKRGRREGVCTSPRYKCVVSQSELGLVEWGARGRVLRKVRISCQDTECHNRSFWLQGVANGCASESTWTPFRSFFPVITPPTPHCLIYYSCLVSLNIEYSDSPTLSFQVKSAYIFQYKFFYSSLSTKTPSEILAWIALSTDQFWGNSHL